MADSGMTDKRHGGEMDTHSYVMPGPNQVRFISNGQTLYLVLGSCISSVLIGKNEDRYFATANHIMIAKEHKSAIIAMKSAKNQIEEMLVFFDKKYRVVRDRIRCLHLVGAGSKVSDTSFHVHHDNIMETRSVLEREGIDILFEDTGSYYFATYSIRDKHISVFVENRLSNTHLSYIIDMEQLFSLDVGSCLALPASGLKPGNRGFEELVERGIVIFITGERSRAGD
ncbi:MAG: hypothetical protein E4G96_06035 [Chrysiogenales bacterium]|nr:MAG: hypothetical protein E4G96_06035 [Chrysiogenales bacterium]